MENSSTRSAIHSAHPALFMMIILHGDELEDTSCIQSACGQRDRDGEVPKAVTNIGLLVCRFVREDFKGALGAFTPCFTDIVILGKFSLPYSPSSVNCIIHMAQCTGESDIGPMRTISAEWEGSTHGVCIIITLHGCAGTAHIVAVLLTTARLVFVRRRCRFQPYRLHGLARVMQCSAIVAALVCLLVELFQLNARIAADPTPLIQGNIAPFEWAGKIPPVCAFIQARVMTRISWLTATCHILQTALVSPGVLISTLPNLEILTKLNGVKSCTGSEVYFDVCLTCKSAFR